MRAKTNRSGRLDFGLLVDHYDRGRMELDEQFVQRTLSRLSCELGDHQLEVGAGTGQLTAALLKQAGTVVAVEPSHPMADRLLEHFPDETESGRLEVRRIAFEDLDADDGPFDHIWSSDAWHWVDPETAYPLAASLLRPGGYLVNTWGFPTVHDVALARALNKVYEQLSPDLVRDSEHQLAASDPLFADGRAEIDSSGLMGVADYWLDEGLVEVEAPRYIDWQLSYAHIGLLDTAHRRRLSEAIAEVLSSDGADLVELHLCWYTVASRVTAG
ncbi:MAG: class I SAM-dependent methyltransferase [Acidimicrobiales bacterium]